MADYPFEQLLSPLDFEYLVRDLLSRELGIELSAFAEGRDGGVDLRCARFKRRSVIVQCKRTKSLSPSALTEEAKKVVKLAPGSYYLAAACNISVAKTDAIITAFAGFIPDDSHIYTKNKLNQLLDKYPDILQKHYKLWLNSASIFNTLINSYLYERAKALISSIQRDYKYYVKSESIAKALEILNHDQFLIISGIPGIGKTTLAKLLLMECLQNDFEVVEIRRVQEGEYLLTEESDNKQVFYFDDFLGENFLKVDVVEGRSNDLIEFVKRVMSNPHKRLIMTTREYILQQATERYEKLESANFEVHKYILDLGAYSKRIKSLIFYNHLYYSGLEEAYIDNILSGEQYKTIINHRNYSPRIIERMTVKLRDVPPAEYAKSFINTLEKPFSIWEKAFDGQISEGSQLVLYVLLSMGDSVLLSELKTALGAFEKLVAIPKGFDFKSGRIDTYLRELEGSFIMIDVSAERNHYLDFQNPSVKDFLLNLVYRNTDLILGLLSAVVYYDQFVYIMNYLAKFAYADKRFVQNTTKSLKKNFDKWKSKTDIFFLNMENRPSLTDFEKIYQLKDVVRKFDNTAFQKFLLEKFEALSISKINESEEENYIAFYLEYCEKLTVNFEKLLEEMIGKLNSLHAAKNIARLEEVDIELYGRTIETHKLTLGQNLKEALEFEIDQADDEDELLSLKEDIETEIEPMFKFDFRPFLKSIEKKLDELPVDEDEGGTIKETGFESAGTERYDENELFNSAMFER